MVSGPRGVEANRTRLGAQMSETQHQFRSRRRQQAIEKRNRQLFDMQQAKLGSEFQRNQLLRENAQLRVELRQFSLLADLKPSRKVEAPKIVVEKVEVEKLVEKIVEVPKIIEKIVEVEKVIEKIIEVPVGRVVEVPVKRVVEQIDEVPEQDKAIVAQTCCSSCGADLVAEARFCTQCGTPRPKKLFTEVEVEQLMTRLTDRNQRMHENMFRKLEAAFEEKIRNMESFNETEVRMVQENHEAEMQMVQDYCSERFRQETEGVKTQLESKDRTISELKREVGELERELEQRVDLHGGGESDDYEFDEGELDDPLDCTLSKGTRVQLFGLRAKASLNGEIGVLHDYVPESGRWQVCLDHTSQMLLVRPMHLSVNLATDTNDVPDLRFNDVHVTYSIDDLRRKPSPTDFATFEEAHRSNTFHCVHCHGDLIEQPGDGGYVAMQREDHTWEEKHLLNLIVDLPPYGIRCLVCHSRTIPCKYYRQGRCMRGSSCVFQHCEHG